MDRGFGGTQWAPGCECLTELDRGHGIGPDQVRAQGLVVLVIRWLHLNG